MRTPSLVLVLIGLVGLVGAPARAQQASASAEQRPNVLFFVLDDLNDWVGCLGGHPQARTPNIDRLAARGVLFTNAHAPAPACNPSRVAIFTGVAPHRSGLYDQSPNFRDLWPDRLTLPQRLRAVGYHPQGAGKVFHKPYADPPSWDDFFPSLELQMAPDSVQRKLEGIVGNHAAAVVDAPNSSLGDGKVADWIAAALRRPPEQPFFIACGIHRPHDPWIAPAEHYAKFPLDSIQLPPTRSDDLDDVPAAARQMGYTPRASPEAAQRAVQAYLACVSFADEIVGQVLDALDASPHAANTIVVLWSDHGFHLGEKQNWSKLTLWEEATRVPLIVVAPGIAGGQRCARPVSLQDLHPTILELCGLPPVEGLDGQSLVPLLRDPSAPRDRPALTTWGFQNHALRSERWRYIRYADGSEELYDHETDPEEWTNLAGDERTTAVKAELARWLPQENAPEVKKEKTKPTFGRPGK